jgi:hypothetical protein
VRARIALWIGITAEQCPDEDRVVDRNNSRAVP